MTSPKPRYTADKLPGQRAWVVRDRQATVGTQILAILQSQFAAQQTAEALNRGLVEAVDSKGRWEDAL